MKKKIEYIICIFILIFVIGCLFHNDSSNMKKVVVSQGNNLMISIDGNSSSTLPTSGNYYLVDYECKNIDTVLEWNNSTHQLKVSNRNKKGGVSCFLDFQSKPKLADMPQGSYVVYTGNNGCTGSSCTGQNANYVSDTDMGYCSASDYKFLVNGWRIAYSKDGSSYLISAGAPECMCTNSDGTFSNSSCSNYESTSGVPMHLANLNQVALKYCSQDYAYGGGCDSNSAWSINASDFQNIMGKALSSSSCNTEYSDRSCGYNNDVIDNGGYYWFASPYSVTSTRAFDWSPSSRDVGNHYSNNLYGVRPILRLESSVLVVGGSGTYEDPYQIINNSFTINNGDEYVVNAGKSAVTLSLVGNDVSQMCISVNTSECSNYIAFNSSYTLDWSSEADGEKTVYVYYKDSAGNIVASMNRSIILDTVAPSNNSVTINAGDGMNRTLTISSTGADYMCISDTSNNVSNCTNWVDYSTSYKWRFSEGTGTKNIYAFFKDKAGNVVGPYSASTTCTNDCYYKYNMDAYNNSYVYLMRNDGATAKVSTSDSGNVTWYGSGSQTMKVCGAYNYSNSTSFWCIGSDNNAYYKTSYNSSSWNKVNISSYINTSNYTYSIYPYSTSYAYIVRSDGKTNRISTSGLASTSWSYGASKNMAVCSGYSSTRVICLGTDGKYYYRTSYSSTTSYSGGTINKLTSRTNANSWIDMYYNTTTDIIESDTTSLYNTHFSYNASSATWYTSSIPGGGVKTCASSGNSTYNYCLGEDGKLYYKSYSSTSWTKSSVTYK